MFMFFTEYLPKLVKKNKTDWSYQTVKESEH